MNKITLALVLMTTATLASAAPLSSGQFKLSSLSCDGRALNASELPSSSLVLTSDSLILTVTDNKASIIEDILSCTTKSTLKPIVTDAQTMTLKVMQATQVCKTTSGEVTEVLETTGMATLTVNYSIAKDRITLDGQSLVSGLCAKTARTVSVFEAN
ncbi:MAG: hypothetical protein JST16_06575 [Bdellovibrionales bacterium]|nr:hypothetical protein [Bdellovibrionales bacterium]